MIVKPSYYEEVSFLWTPAESHTWQASLSLSRTSYHPHGTEMRWFMKLMVLVHVGFKDSDVISNLGQSSQHWLQLAPVHQPLTGAGHGWMAFWKTQRVKSFLVPLLTCKSPPQQHFEGQAASYWDRRRALRAKELWKGPEQDLATNKFSFDKNFVQGIASEILVTFSYLQWVWHEAIKISKKFTVNLIKVVVTENDNQIDGFRLPHSLKTF